MTNATLVGAYSGNSGSSSQTSVSCTLTSVQVGDLVLALVCIERSTATAGTPVTGASNAFTSDANTANTSMAWSLSHYTLVAGDITAGSVTVTSTASGGNTRRQAIDCIVFRGQSSLAFQGGTYTQNADGVVTATAPSITPTENDATIVSFLASISNVSPFIRTQSVDSPFTMRGNNGSTAASSTNAYVTGASRGLSGGSGASQAGATFNDTTSPTPTKFHWFAGTYAVGPLSSLSYELTDGVGVTDPGVTSDIFAEHSDAVGITDSIVVTLPDSIPPGVTAGYSYLIDWFGDGDFGDAGDDVTSSVLSERYPVHVQYGREIPRTIEDAGPGEAKLALNNVDRTYSPDNGVSALAGLVGPGKEIIIRAAFGSFTYNLYRGFLDDFNVLPSTSDQAVTLSCLDTLGRLAQQTISTPLYQGVRTGQAVNFVLDAAGWPSGLRDIDAGHSALPWYWEEGTTALDALRTLVRAEGPPAYVTVDGSGQIVFRDRMHRFLRDSSISAQAVFTDSVTDTTDEPRFADSEFTYDSGWRAIVNRVNIDVPIRACTGVLEPIWSTDVPFTLSDGETVRLTASSSDPFLGAVPPVVGTDLILSSGSGVTCALDRTSGASVTISVTATSGAATVLSLALRAAPVVVATTAHISVSDSASIETYGERTYSHEVPWVNPHDALAIGNAIVVRYAERLPVVTFKLGGNPTRLQHQLSRNLSDQITIIESRTGLNGAFFIERIEHDVSRTGRVHSTTFGCEQAPAGITNPFRFDTDGAGFNQGLFAKDGQVLTPLFIFDVEDQGFNAGLFAN